MIKWFFLGLLAAVALWLAGGYLTLPATQKTLKAASEAVLAKPEHLKAFEEVKVEFVGQIAQLTGQVGTVEEKALAGQIIANDVRADRWFGSGLNPVEEVRNGIEISTTLLYAKPRPWLLAALWADQLQLAGVAGDAASAKAASDAITKQASGSKPLGTIAENKDARPSKDWAATLANVPDLKAALAKAPAGEGIVAVSGCDGKWQVFSGNESVVTIAQQGLAAAGTPSDLVSVAVQELSNYQAAEREKARVAKLPAAIAAVTLTPTTANLFGALGDPADRKAIVDSLANSFKGLRINDQSTLSSDVKPGGVWSTSLAALPTKTDPSVIAVLKPGEKPVLWSGKDGVKGLEKELATALPKNDKGEQVKDLTAAILHAPIDAYVAEKKAIDDAAKAKAEADAKAKAEADAKMAADKAKMDAAKPATPTQPQATPPTAQSPAVTPSLPAYLGWTLNAGTLSLFGALPNNQVLEAAKKAATAAYPGAQLNTDGIIIDVKRALPADAAAKFASTTEVNKPQVGLAVLGSPAKTYALDVFDSEIAKDWPQLSFAEGELGRGLASFREAQLKAGGLKADEPYLSLFSDGKRLTIVGEVADAATKDKLLAAVKAANPGLTYEDRLATTPLVSAVADVASTISSLPKFEPGKPGSAAARPGQQARAGVIHAIYFATGSDRSKDQERALAQVRRLLAAVPSAKVEIVGNTDNVGAAEANTKLSQERADKFAAYLTSNGIDKAALITKGAGPANPIADNATDAGKALNRRVDVLLK